LLGRLLMVQPMFSRLASPIPGSVVCDGRPFEHVCQPDYSDARTKPLLQLCRFKCRSIISGNPRRIMISPFFQRKVWIGCDDLIHAEIPLAARMFAYMDVWDALVPNRPYRRAMEKSEIRAHFGQEGKPEGCSTQIS
jgi:hypothetical protein